MTTGPIVRHDIITEAPLRALAATLPAGLIVPSAAIPPLAHWLYFLDQVAREQIGPDGHSAREPDAPGAGLPRRMWAGSSLTFERPILRGAAVTRTSNLAGVTEKVGRSGRLVFVQMDHQVTGPQGLLLSERQDIVYREAATGETKSVPPTPAPTDPQWRRRIEPDPVMLFRYSATTFNSHRIHYDRPYAVEQEGYAGLVVHGPLLATLLVNELASRCPGRAVTRFQFTAVRPVIDIAPFDVCGSLAADGAAELFIADAEGALCMRATATLGPEEP